MSKPGRKKKKRKKRSIKSSTKNDDEFIPIPSENPKMFIGANNLDNLDLETIQDLDQDHLRVVNMISYHHTR